MTNSQCFTNYNSTIDTPDRKHLTTKVAVAVTIHLTKIMYLTLNSFYPIKVQAAKCCACFVCCLNKGQDFQQVYNGVKVTESAEFSILEYAT